MTESRYLISCNIKKLRKKRCLTQAQLAERCGLSINYISALETGKSYPSDETQDSLSQALNVKQYELFADDDSELDTDLKQELLQFKQSIVHSLSQLETKIGYARSFTAALNEHFEVAEK